ncbi:hypothetical protein BZG36_03490 [Bifiguratus adelaidae]|uniref:N-acetyltransferase domain-containing protein n=1 Tax=Bifiguratus adelaidae TaxID=1938954 RepID=A0A261XWN6_9FUNG|nr:hypothetical protein BZG36_03490 [Bifiguratus adelaidae]
MAASDDIYIRPCVPADAVHVPQVCKMIYAAYRSEASWTTEAHIVSGERISEENLREFIEDNHQPDILLFAFQRSTDLSVPDRVVGTIQLEPKPDHDEALIGLLSVDPTFQSKGIGSKLVRTALEYSKKDLKLSKGVIWVLRNRDDILKWYTRMGFVDSGSTQPFPWPELLKQKDMHFKVLKKIL